MSENTERGEEKSVFSLVWDFFSYTTAHGFPRIPGSKTCFQRIFWCLIVAGAFGMFFWQVYGLLQSYMSRHVATRIKMQHETVRTFLSIK